MMSEPEQVKRKPLRILVGPGLKEADLNQLNMADAIANTDIFYTEALRRTQDDEVFRKNEELSRHKHQTMATSNQSEGRTYMTNLLVQNPHVETEYEPASDEAHAEQVDYQEHNLMSDLHLLRGDPDKSLDESKTADIHERSMIKIRGGLIGPDLERVWKENPDKQVTAYLAHGRTKEIEYLKKVLKKNLEIVQSDIAHFNPLHELRKHDLEDYPLEKPEDWYHLAALPHALLFMHLEDQGFDSTKAILEREDRIMKQLDVQDLRDLSKHLGKTVGKGLPAELSNNMDVMKVQMAMITSPEEIVTWLKEHKKLNFTDDDFKP